ncbi:hypothetical protein [Sulfuracidifex metallicus]|uniref:Uncharacterized protein n=1 Tax=Sulfuracidifex metallicus DSM 6482 = JCM 9184 TaxID=523847 RepID=A0A6A9QNB6_SULME|nr:hypothetical protein [Sulfuracidifex metallicus]MUN29649.1 hypothetical protein [Sulfuracidifex metallicus DSM 6482 = JCM 9184]
MKVKVFSVLLLLIPSLLFAFTVSGSEAQTTQVNFSEYSISFHSINSVLNVGTTTMTISNATFNGTVSGQFKVMKQTATYLVSEGKTTHVNGTLTVHVNQDGFVSVRSPIPLTEVEVSTDSQNEVVWAGAPSSEVQGYAYINGTGTLTAYFLNGTSMDKIELNVSAEGNFTLPINYTVNEPSLTIKSTSESEITVELNGFERYHSGNFMMNGSSYINIGGVNYSLSTSYFEGKYVPSMIWRAMTTGVIVGNGAEVNYMNVEFFGVNGTEAGFVRSMFVSNEGQIGFASNSFQHSRLLIVRYEGVSLLSGPTFTIESNGVKVMVVYNHDNVSTTAYVKGIHKVQHGLLVKIFVNSSSYLFVNSSNATTVPQVKPQLTHVNIKVNSTIYNALEADINASGYALFNLTVQNGSFLLYKNVNGQLILVNHEDYFISNNTLIVFSDPAQQYYLIYTNNTSQVSTSSSSYTSTSSMSSSSSSSQSSYTSSSTSSSTISPSMSTSTPSSSASSNVQNYTVYIIAVIVVILIAVGIALLLRRK